MPLGLSSKALGWGHDLLATTAIKYYTHNQAVSGKKRKSNFCVEEDGDNMDARIVSVGQDWAEASSLHEIAEAVHNWASVRFQCAPWKESDAVKATHGLQEGHGVGRRGGEELQWEAGQVME